MMINATEKKMDIPFIHFASFTKPFSLKLIARNPFVSANKAVINNTATYKFPLIIKTNAAILTAANNSPATQLRFMAVTHSLKKVGAFKHRLLLLFFIFFFSF